MNESRFVILGGGMVAGYAAKQLVEMGLKPGELTIPGSSWRTMTSPVKWSIQMSLWSRRSSRETVRRKCHMRLSVTVAGRSRG